MMVSHDVSAPNEGDFFIDDTYTFNIGDKEKNTNQIKSVNNAYIAADDLEKGVGNKIPLWLFGFLY